MAAPLKPWERAGINNLHSSGQGLGNGLGSMSPFTDQMAASLPMSSSIGMGLPQMSAPRQAPPTVPARNTAQTRTLPYTGGGMYGGGGYGMYGGGLGSVYSGGGYGGYGGYGSGYGSYGGGMYGMNRGFGAGQNEVEYGGFAQQAELSSRAAFQSIESVVQAVGSVSMMLDSTFQAVYNSFRAVVGVADQFSRVRTTLANIFSALAIWRSLRWMFRRVLVLLRLRNGAGVTDDVWSEAVTQAGAEVGELAGLTGESGGGGEGKTWPIMLFFAIIFGAPWLLWRLLSKFSGQKDASSWASGVDDHFLAVAEFDFDAENPDELSFKQGTRIVIAPKELQPRIRGWLLASVDGKKTGILPANHIKLLGRRRGTKHTQQLQAGGAAVPSSAYISNASAAVPSTSSIPSFAIPSISTQTFPQVPTASSLPSQAPELRDALPEDAPNHRGNDTDTINFANDINLINEFQRDST